MSSSKKSLADKIVRETPRADTIPQPFFGGGMGMMAPMHPVPFGPANHFAPP